MAFHDMQNLPLGFSKKNTNWFLPRTAATVYTTCTQCLNCCLNKLFQSKIIQTNILNLLSCKDTVQNMQTQHKKQLLATWEKTLWEEMHTCDSLCTIQLHNSLIPSPSITANAVEDLVKLLCRMMSGGPLEAWLIMICACTSTAVHRKCHASRCLPDVILHRSFTKPSTTLAVIEGLGTRLAT